MMDGSGAARRARSPSAVSSVSDQLEKLRKDKYRIPDLPPPSRDHVLSTSHSSRSGSGDKGKNKERADLPGKTPPAIGPLIRRPRSPSPLEPSRPPPMQPPPPPPQIPGIPKLPSFASGQQSTDTSGASKGLKELSMDEQRAAWHERIDLMFTSITARRDFAKLEADLPQIRLLSDSSIFNNMKEADRARINSQRMSLELQIATKRSEINETIQKLIGSNFWPILKTSQISEMERTLGEAKKHVLEVRSSLEDVKSSCEALFKTSSPGWTPDSDRPLKRRRVNGEADNVGSAGGNAEVMAVTTAKELEEFRDKLAELHGHFTELQNDITQRDAVISDEIELHIESRLQEEDALYPPVTGPTEVSEREIEVVVDAKNKDLVRSVTQTGDEIGVLAVEVAELITKVNVLEARCKVLEAENQEFKNRLAQDTQQHAESQDDLLRRGKEIEAIAAALQAFISQTSTGQTMGDLPSTDYIIESLESHLDGLFREKFGPKLGDVQQEIFSVVKEWHNRTIDTVSPKIMVLLRMVNLIAARVGKPAETDAPNAV